MKRTFFTFFFLLAMANVYAYDIAVENADGVTIYYNYINDGQELEVTNNDRMENSYSGVVVIPSEVTFMNRTLKVTNIGKSAFWECIDLDSLAIPGSVTSIGDYAFSECHQLTYLTIPKGVTCIGEGVFWGCTNLTSVTIPEGVTSIGERAFCYCISLNDVTIPNSVVSIDEFAFSLCKSLTSIIIPDGVTSIGYYAFNSCTNLTTVALPNSVRSIGQGAFENCNIQSVTSLIKEPFAIEGKAVKDNRTFSEYTFDNATLYVPLGSIDKYKAAEGWKDFAQILTVHGLEYDYRPFIERAKVWRTGIPNPDGEGYSQLYNYIFCPYPRDTLINGQRCALMGRCRLVDYGDGIYGELDTVYVGALYEKDRQVFCAYPGSQELVLHYDFASPVGSVVSIGGNELAIVSKESVQGENYKGESVYLQSEDHVVCWQEGIGNRFTPMENLHGLHPTGASDEVLISCSVGDEVLYYNGSPFAGGNEVKKNTIDFTHVVKTQPKAPRSLSPSPSPTGEGSEGSELTGEYSLKKLFVNFKPLAGPYVITICDDSGTEVYRKEVQTSNVIGLNTDISGYEKGEYTITVENEEEAYTASFSIDDAVGINRPTPAPSLYGGEKAGANKSPFGGLRGAFDLSGRKVIGTALPSPTGEGSGVRPTLPRGVYIKDGRKIVVR